jgi:hypothetical protein
LQIKRTDGNPPDWHFKDSSTKIVFDVFISVNELKKISFKQFKLLSAFSKMNWLADEKQEFKQF